MKYLPSLALVGIGLFAGLLLMSPSGAQSGTKEKIGAIEMLPRNIVIRVGDRRVDAEEVLAYINEFENTQGVGDQHLRKAVQFLLNLQFVRAEAERLGISTTPEELDVETESQIEQTKKLVFENYGPSVPYEQYLANLHMTEADFRKLVRSRAEQILLRRRLVRLWELCSNKVQAMEVRLDRKRDADQFLGQIDSYFEDLELLNLWDFEEQEGRKPSAHPRLRLWNADKAAEVRKKLDARGASKAAIFGYTMAWELNKRNAGRNLNLIEGEPVDPRAYDLLFKTMKEGSHTSVLEFGPTDYRIYFLSARIEANPQPYSALKETINKMEGPDEDLFLRWVNSVYNAERYRVSTRIPGNEQINVLTRAEREALEAERKAREEEEKRNSGDK